MTDILPLIEQDLGPGRRLGSWTFWHCPFHQGDGTPSLGLRNGRFYCFACQAEGDGVDWLVQYRHLPKREALRRKANNNGHKKAAQDDIPPLVTPSQAWQDAALNEVLAAHQRLFAPEGQAWRDYLASRGLTEATAIAWSLGAGWAHLPGTDRGVKALFIPYLDGHGQVLAVKYRFIGQDLTTRYVMRKGGKGALYGMWQELKPFLVLVEGEFNALSIWQTLNGSAAVLSCGGQTNRLDMAKRLLVAARKSGVKTLAWFDKPDIARTFKPLADVVISSPVLDGVKHDANEMLKRGLLGEFLVKLLEVER